MLTMPYPQLRYNLAHTPTAVVCRQAVQHWGDKIRQHPIGSGAYFLAEHLKEQRLVLQANPIYRGGPEVESGTALPPDQRLPHIKRVQYDYFDESVPVWLLFRQGMLDIAGIPKESFSQAITTTGDLTPAMQKDGIELIKGPGPELFYYGCNMSDPVVGKNKPLRQALSLAFDRDTYIKIYLNGRGNPATGPIPPGFPTYDPADVSPYARFDLAAARAKLAEAEKIAGSPIPELTLLMPASDTGARQVAEFFASQMAQIGLKVKPEYCTWARFQEKVDSKQAQIYTLGWVADYPDEQTFLQLFYGKNAGPNGINSSDYQNPEYDTLYEQAMVMEPGPARDQLYKRMARLVNEDCPWILSDFPVGFSLHYRWLKNIKLMDYGHGLRMYLELDSAMRARWHAH